MLVGKIYADWCGACQQFDPLWKKLNAKHGTKHEFHEYNQGDKHETSIAVDGHNVEYDGFPTIFKIDKGKVHKFSGARDDATFEQWLAPRKRKHTRKRRRHSLAPTVRMNATRRRKRKQKI